MRKTAFIGCFRCRRYRSCRSLGIASASAHRKAEIEDKNHQIYQTGAEYNVRQTQKLFTEIKSFGTVIIKAFLKSTIAATAFNSMSPPKISIH